MTRPLVVIPHGTGIGDMINERPLLAAIAAHFPERSVSVLAPPPLGWLLPDGLSIARLPGIRPWVRVAADSRAAHLAGVMSVRTTDRLVRKTLLAKSAVALRLLLRAWNLDVISLLEAFVALDLDARWTCGMDTGEAAHVIDLLAGHLAEAGIDVHPNERRPRIPLPASFGEGERIAILSPNAGSTLKEPPPELWVRLGKRLMHSGIPVAVLEAPGRHAARSVAASIPCSRRLQFPHLPDVAAALAGAGVVVSPDSGILHLAAALGIPYVGLFGATDARFHGPYPGTAGKVITSSAIHDNICRRCWTGQLFPRVACPVYGPATCLAGIDPDPVAEAALDLWRTEEPRCTRRSSNQPGGVRPSQEFDDRWRTKSANTAFVQPNPGTEP